MASPLAGCWQLYGTENPWLLLDNITLPAHIKWAATQVRVSEEVHVNGDSVHLNIHVPTYSVPCSSRDINFTFGVEHDAVMPWGTHTKATAQKVSDNKWVANITHESGYKCTITREYRNGEMWVTWEGKESKLVQKFERTENKAASQCADQKGTCSPFQGSWRLYGTDNFEHFTTALGVPQFWRYILSRLCINETIHVNGDDVHVKVCTAEFIVPGHFVESSFKFNESSEHTLFYGQKVTASVQKLSDSKWHSKLTCAQGNSETTVTREIVGDETWLTFISNGKRAVFKFSRRNSSCNASSCK